MIKSSLMRRFGKSHGTDLHGIMARTDTDQIVTDLHGTTRIRGWFSLPETFETEISTHPEREERLVDVGPLAIRRSPFRQSRLGRCSGAFQGPGPADRQHCGVYRY
jgi:hypothetical protein